MGRFGRHLLERQVLQRKNIIRKKIYTKEAAVLCDKRRPGFRWLHWFQLPEAAHTS
jgi:hypothetical protein